LMVRVFQYSFVQAKTRALKGRLLSAEDWHFLLRARTLGEVLRYLAGTDYAEAVSQLHAGEFAGKAAAPALYDQLFSSYAKLLRAVPQHGSRLITSLLLRFDAENLKTILRGIWQQKSPAEISPLLYRLHGLSRLPVDQLFQVQTVTDALELLRSTTFYLPIKHAQAQFQAQGRLFPLDMAIDITVFERLVEALKSVRGLDRKGAKDLIGELVDLENLSWLVRFRFYYGLSPEELINYLLHGGRRLGIQKLGALARSVELEAFLAQLPPPYRKALQPATAWTDIQPLSNSWLVQQLYRVFSRDPFQIRLPLAFLLLKEIEVRALERLLTAWDMGETAGSLACGANLPLPGAAHV
jgi:V/A-type H+/Na+-transporting ATPase subunit C